jgi:hypothetical protein
VDGTDRYLILHCEHERPWDGRGGGEDGVGQACKGVALNNPKALFLVNHHQSGSARSGGISQDS